MGESGVIKSVVIFLLLAVFSLVAGSMVADSAKEAIIPALLVAGIAALIYLGKNCWWLIFIAPPVILTLGIVQTVPVVYGFFCGLVLIYWLLQAFLGHARLTWNGLCGLDVMTLILVIYFLSTWVRHPVTINSFASIYDEGDVNVGGQDYVWCLCATVSYITFSVIPMKYEAVIRVLKIVFWVSLLASILAACKAYLIPISQPSETLLTGSEDLRSSPFAQPCKKVIYYIFSRYSIIGIVLSPWKMCVLLLSFLALARSGFRSFILEQIIYIVVVSFIYRQIILALLFAGGIWFTIVVMSHSGAFDSTHFSIQRTLSSVPGVQLSDKKAVCDAQESLDWRYDLWEMGWNPKYGYIEDYVWGDGFALSLASAKRQGVLFNRGEVSVGHLPFYAENGVWHSGALVVVHRTGYVGLILLNFWFLILIFVAVRVCYNIRFRLGAEYVFVYILAVVPSVVMFYASTGTWTEVFSDLFYTAAIAKILYVLCIQEKIMKPLLEKKVYVPLMHRMG